MIIDTAICIPGAHDWVHRTDRTGEYQICTECGKRARWVAIWSRSSA